MRNPKFLTKHIATALIVSCMLTEIMLPVQALAASQKVGVDETMYMNLDAYGAVSQVNVVKGITFNSVNTYTDFGDYKSITNMSTNDQPAKNADGSITWTAPKGRSKFFFEGTLDPQSVQAPWTFDVTYKVNGVVTPAEQVGGSSGLIEMDIDAYPNTSVSDYMKNNMMLMVAVPVDMSKCYSVDAPDSQTQSIGEYSAVVFAGLPGKEGHFVVRVGTDSYESIGAIMMMTPGTLGQLSDIKDIKELKDKFRDNTNAMLDDVDDVMDNITDIQSQLTLTNQALDSLQAGKDKLHSSKDSIFGGNDVAIQDLRNMANTLTPLDSSLKTSQWMIYDINKSLNATDEDLLKSSAQLKTLVTNLKQLAGSMGAVDDSSVLAMQKELKDMQTGLTAVNNGLSENIKNPSSALNQATDKISQDYVASVSEATYDQAKTASDAEIVKEKLKLETLQNQYAAIKDDHQALLAKQGANLPLTATQSVALSKYNELAQSISNVEIDVAADTDDATVAAQNLLLQGIKENMKQQINSANSVAKYGTITTLSYALDDYLANVSAVTGDSLDDLSSQILSVAAKIENITDDGASVSYSAARTLNSMRDIIGDLDGLVATMNSYYDDTQELIENSTVVLEQLQVTANDTANALQNVNNVIRNASEDFGNATDTGIELGRQATENTSKVIDNTQSLKSSGTDLRTSINNELDEKEAENNFLNMDPEAPKVSLTSSNNQEPDSIQIVCRTEEIKLPDKKSELLDAEEAAASTTVWQRIKSVFSKIGNLIKTIMGAIG